MTEADRDRIRAVAAPFGNATLRFQSFDIDRFSHFRTDGHISHASYLRIFIPEILPDSEEKVLYLDCDIVVRHDIEPLWYLEIGRAHVCTPVPNAHLVCRLLLAKKKNQLVYHPHTNTMHNT